MNISRLDHLVLTVKDIAKTVSFYESVLGMSIVNFGDDRVALKFGTQKINLHEVGKELNPRATQPAPGSADLCFIVSTTLPEAMEHVASLGVQIIEGPVRRNGAKGPILSFYVKDPDGNLIEIANEI
jgi:catechol 2,3-dioxygenase-like lactoylglutathione lyase family enzyme